MKKFKNLLKFYQNARKTERKLTDFVHLKCKIGREPHIRLPQTQEKHIKPVGATTMFSKKTCRIAMRSSEIKTDEWTKWKVTLYQDHSSTASGPPSLKGRLT